MEITKPHVALLASPGLGHLIPILELAKRLATSHNLHVTVFVVADRTSGEQLSNQDFLDVVLLPTADISGLDPETSVVTKIIIMMQESLPILRSAISSMKSRPTALIVDLFGTDAMVIADEFEMLKYVFYTSNAWCLAVSIYAPAIERKALHEHANYQKPLQIPGCSPLRYEDTLEPFLEPDGPMLVGLLKASMDMSTADGILVNTWEDLEPKTLRALRDSNMLQRVVKAPIYSVGPLVRDKDSLLMLKNQTKTRSVKHPNSLEKEVLDWLEKQPTESVIYVSFGSGGTLSAEQMIELAWGLELSQQRFIWVVRPPLENDVTGAFFSLGNCSAVSQDYLPDGFLTRTHNVGLVIPMWAPQAEILAHPSVGGFLSHCGWNSILESIANGLPMIAWPLYSEQKMNATMLTEEIGIAVRSKELPTKSIVGRGEVGMLVRKIMVDKDGHAIKNKVKQLKLSSEKSSGNGGSSYISLSDVAKRCERSLQYFKVKAQGG